MFNDQAPIPPSSFTFQLTGKGLGNDEPFYFQEVSGIVMEATAEGSQAGGENRFQHRLPGVAKSNNLVLKRGLMASDSVLLQWINNTFDSTVGPITPKDITVTLMDEGGKPLMSWDFIAAYPVKWAVSDLHSAEQEVAVETLEFTYTSFQSNVGEQV